MSDIFSRLLNSDEPAVRYDARVRVLGQAPESPEARQDRESMRSSTRVARLLSPRGGDGRFPGSPYAKFTGPHWVLALLADLGYPPGDAALLPLRDQVLDFCLAPQHLREKVFATEAASYRARGWVPVIEGRARRCGSTSGNALCAALALGIADERADELARLLARWQWPDGGWNCDRSGGATNSSFHETLIWKPPPQ